MNIMRNLKIDKVTLNFGAGTDQKKLEKGLKLLKLISGKNPVKTYSRGRVPAWGLRVGLPIGCMITVRGKEAEQLLGRLLKAKEYKLKPNIFDTQGNFSFGIHEYVDITDVKYDPEIGIIGFETAVTLRRPGYRVSIRRLRSKALPKKQIISAGEAQEFIKQKFNVRFEV